MDLMKRLDKQIQDIDKKWYADNELLLNLIKQTGFKVKDSCDYIQLSCGDFVHYVSKHHAIEDLDHTYISYLPKHIDKMFKDLAEAIQANKRLKNDIKGSL